MTKYKCSICGFVYDPEEGYPDDGIRPGTPFENIDPDWKCPLCGTDKELFLPIS